MSASIFKMGRKTHNVPPANPLDELHAERDRLGAELSRLGVVDQRVAAAAAAVLEVDHGISALDRADVEQMQRWAESGEGDAPPKPLTAERRALLARRLDLQAEAEGARVAADALTAKRTSLIRELNRVGLKVRERQIASALGEARALHAEAEALGAEIAAKLMRVMGLRKAISDANTEALNRNEADQALNYQGALSVLGAFQPPAVLADPATVAQHAAEWRAALR